MSVNGNQVPAAPNQRGPGPYPRVPTPHRGECYHPGNAAGGGYMGGTAGGQGAAQQSLRVQPAQPSAPPAPQQDMTKASLGGHSFVPPQNQTPQQRAQYQNFQFRAQPGSRPNTHPRQQQPYLPGATVTASGPVMYHPQLIYPQAQMGLPQSAYQQPRNQFFQFVPNYLNYTTPTGHTPPYYYQPNSQQIPAQNLQPTAPGARNNPTSLVPPGTPASTIAPLPHPQAQSHIHPTIPGMRTVPGKRVRSNAVRIINPKTNREVLSDESNDSQNVSGDSSERQTPQNEASSHSVAEEFFRKVSEAVKEPAPGDNTHNTNKFTKSSDVVTSVPACVPQQQTTAIPALNKSFNKNINVVNCELLNVNDSKNVAIDVSGEPSETPVVSAICDKPEIVPINIKQLQKTSEQYVQPVVVDTSNKNVPAPKQHNKQVKSKPFVPQQEEVEKSPIVAVAAAPVEPPVKQITPPPQPQRIRESRERVKPDEREKPKVIEAPLEEVTSAAVNTNGPMPVAEISPADSLPENTNSQICHSNQSTSIDLSKRLTTNKQTSPSTASNITEIKEESVCEPSTAPIVPTPKDLLEASIEKAANDSQSEVESREASSAIEAQAKLTQSLASCLRTSQTESKMKDINLNNKTADPDTANGNTTVTKTETVKDINKNESVKNSKSANKKSAAKMATDSANLKAKSFENGKVETDEISNTGEESSKEEAAQAAPVEEPGPPPAPVFIPKYKYSDDQWSPLNTTGKKCYDIGLLKQIKEDPMSKNKPDVPLLESVIRVAPMQDMLSFSNISRSMNDSPLFPTFLKSSSVGGSRNNNPRDPKKDGRNMPAGKGSLKLQPSSSGNPQHKVILVSLREDVKLNETENAWKPSRFKKGDVDEDDFKTQDLYKRFRGILNKLTPQKFDTLLDRVKTLEINNETRLKGVIALVFEKAIEEPNFSEAYAAMCNKLSTLKVPADNPTTPDKCVNFRGLIISKCQTQFETAEVDKNILKLEKEIAECEDPVKKKELQLQLDEENRRVRKRSVGNIRFIGELYKLKMLTSKIMVYCMNNLVEKLEEEKLECLCKLLTTIGEQVESEARDKLDVVFKRMQDIVERKSSKISSRVRFMIQDVIELRRRKWVTKNIVDQQPKMMDQIQKEAEQQQRHIELMNSSTGGGFRRDDGGRGKRNDNRRGQNTNPIVDNTWKYTRITVDRSKLKAVAQQTSTNIKLAPQNSGWSHGSGTKNTAQAASTSMISLNKNKFSVLENVQADPTSLRGNKDLNAAYHSKGASIERSTFNTRSEINSRNGSRSGSIQGARSNSSSRSGSQRAPTPVAEPQAPAPATPEPLTEALKKSVKAMIDLGLINPNDDEIVSEVKHLFSKNYHGGVIGEILNVALEKPANSIYKIAKTVHHLVATNTISPEDFVAGLAETFEFAPDLHIDIPLLYEFLGKFVSPQIEKKYATIVQIHRLCNTIIAANHGHLLLRAIVSDLKESMGPSFVKSKWQESGLSLKNWMNEDMVSKFIEDNKFEFLESSENIPEESTKILTPSEIQSKLLQLMNADETCDCIKGWVLDNLSKASNEEWFMRALIQAVCEHALFSPDGRREVPVQPHFNQDRMSKYSRLINEFGETRESRETSCLFGIQQLIHRLEHPQGLTLEIFQYLHEQYIISVEGFIAWEDSEKEPEGRGVMMKALTSFFTNIKEADNEDSCSED